ncbi:hypothetical protein [Malikia spinosa]|uniref:hypothetical protein n=1 Tax=Malikia spinosa TaxID=86180 RepID=UPI001F399929|nr:hypothetical protein [Malikia spinosa]
MRDQLYRVGILLDFVINPIRRINQTLCRIERTAHRVIIDEGEGVTFLGLEAAMKADLKFSVQGSAAGNINLIVASTGIHAAELDHRRRSAVQRQSIGEIGNARRITGRQDTEHLDRCLQ